MYMFQSYSVSLIHGGYNTVKNDTLTDMWAKKCMKDFL